MAAYLVLEVDRGIEIWYLRVDRLADHLTLTSMHEGSHFYDSQHFVRFSVHCDGFYLELQQEDRKIAGNLHDLWQPNH